MRLRLAVTITASTVLHYLAMSGHREQSEDQTIYYGIISIDNAVCRESRDIVSPAS